MRKIVIVGGGVIGLSVGLELLTDSNNQVTIYSDGGRPTARVACAWFYPYLASDDSNAEIGRLFAESKLLFDKKYAAGDPALKLIRAYDFYDETEDVSDSFVNNVSDLKVITDKDQLLPGSVELWSFMTYVIDTSLYLDELEKSYLKAGGKIQEKKCNYLGDLLNDYDYVINCAGLGANSLTVDSQLRGVRGCNIIIKNPGIDVIIGGDPDIIIAPRSDGLYMGSYFKDPDTLTDEQVIEYVWDACTKKIREYSALHSLNISDPKKSDIISTNIANRPYRTDGPRIEVDDIEPRIIHCYGHGGSGVCLSLASAKRVAAILAKK